MLAEEWGTAGGDGWRRREAERRSNVALGADLGVIDGDDGGAGSEMGVGAVVVAVLDGHRGDAGGLEALREIFGSLWTGPVADAAIEGRARGEALRDRRQCGVVGPTSDVAKVSPVGVADDGD